MKNQKRIRNGDMWNSSASSLSAAAFQPVIAIANEYSIEISETSNGWREIVLTIFKAYKTCLFNCHR